MTLKNLIAADVSGVLFRTDDFAASVTISRGALSTPDVAAVQLESLFQAVGEDTPLTVTRSSDFQLPAANYTINGAQTEPRRGDRITMADGTVYEVLPPEGMPAWTPASPTGDVINVHTKRIS